MWTNSLIRRVIRWYRVLHNLRAILVTILLDKPRERVRRQMQSLRNDQEQLIAQLLRLLGVVTECILETW